MALRLTRPFRAAAERHDCHPALEKMWGKYTPVQGEVIRHLSPNEQKIIVPFLKHAPAKAARRIRMFGPYWVLLFTYVYGTVKGAELYCHGLDVLHRS